MYYVVINYPYEGCSVTGFTTEKAALSAYKMACKSVDLDQNGNIEEDSYLNGVALLRGRMLSSKGSAIEEGVEVIE